MSEWEPRSEDYPRHERHNDGVRRLLGAVKDVGQQVRESTSNLLRTAGLFITDAGLRVASSLSVDGELRVTGATRIEGTLSLPAGIIDNEALANPVTFDSSYGGSDSFGLPAETWVEVAATTIVIPEGFTRFQFTAVGMMNGLNSTASTQNLYLQFERSIDGGPPFTSQRGQVALPAGFQGIANVFYIWNEGVLPGSTHRFSVKAWASGAFAPSEYNYAFADVQALFSR